MYLTSDVVIQRPRGFDYVFAVLVRYLKDRRINEIPGEVLEEANTWQPAFYKSGLARTQPVTVPGFHSRRLTSRSARSPACYPSPARLVAHRAATGGFMRRLIALTTIAVFWLGMLTACAVPSSLQLNPSETTVEYRFRDSSVPPEYHRSYVIKASVKEASITVDSYGDVLRQETAAMPAETWTDVIELARSLPERTKDITAPKPGCAGGTASKVIVREGEQERYSQRIEDCGGGPVTPLTDTAAPLEALFDMKDLLKTGG